MRIAFLALFTLVTSFGAFAQGKALYGNDSLHLIIFDPSPLNLTLDYSAFAGQPVPQSIFCDFTAEVYAGVSPSTLTLQLTRSGSDVGNMSFDAGRLANALIRLTGMPALAPAYFQVRLFETTAGSYDDSVQSYFVHGESPVFKVTPSAFVYSSLVLHVGPGFSTWTDTPIILSSIPEPSALVMAGLGVGTGFLLRRRG